MAFANKFGNLLKQSITSNPSLYQAIRFMSSSKLFIGGLSYGTDDQSLREAFSNYGEVVEARVILDRESGRSRGFGFVSFVSTEEASAAITAMDGQELHGRMVRVNYAADRNRGGGGYGGGGYSGDNYSGGGGYGGGGGGYGGGGYGGGGSSGDNYSGGGGYGGGGYRSGGGGGYGADGYRSGGGSGVSGGGGGNFAGDSYTGGGNAAAGFGGSGGNDNYSSKMSGGGGYDNANQNEPLDDEFKDGDAEPGDYTNRQG